MIEHWVEVPTLPRYLVSNLCDRSENMLHAFRLGLAEPVFQPLRVRIIETGEVFDSTGQIDRYLNVSSGSVSKTLRGLQASCKGYTFELVEEVMPNAAR